MVAAEHFEGRQGGAELKFVVVEAASTDTLLEAEDDLEGRKVGVGVDTGYMPECEGVKQGSQREVDGVDDEPR